jgi:hypothetical protein
LIRESWIRMPPGRPEPCLTRASPADRAPAFQAGRRGLDPRLSPHVRLVVTTHASRGSREADFCFSDRPSRENDPRPTKELSMAPSPAIRTEASPDNASALVRGQPAAAGSCCPTNELAAVLGPDVRPDRLGNALVTPLSSILEAIPYRP